MINKYFAGYQPGEAATDARWLITLLFGLGVKHFVYCPGSRSAPFAYALAEIERLNLADGPRIYTRIDERAAAFFALGLAKSEMAPAAVIMTSGTAVGHCLPAVMEASHSGVPLLVISADRPWEMWEIGASQTTRQRGIFGNFVRRSLDIPAGFRDLGKLYNQLAHLQFWWQGSEENPGPLHINIGFREPLVPTRPAFSLVAAEQLEEVGEESPAEFFRRVLLLSATQTPLFGHSLVKNTGECDAVKSVAVLPVNNDRTVIIVGQYPPGQRIKNEAVEAYVANWSAAGYVVLAEPGTAAFGAGTRVGYQQQLVSAFKDEIETVIVVGKPTLSRPITQLINDVNKQIVVVTAQPDYPDLTGSAQIVLTELPQLPPVTSAGLQWREKWLSAAYLLQKNYQEMQLSDGLKATQLLWEKEEAVNLVVGASNSVRYLDLVAASTVAGKRVYTNRGQAGIDGTIAFARGVVAGSVRNSTQGAYLLVGDVTFLHDASSLLRADDEGEMKLDIIVLDDSGGRIFKSLEHGVSADERTYEKYFAMPQNVDYSSLAKAYGWEYHRIVGLVTTAAQQEYLRLIEMKPSGRIIHIVCDHADIRERISELFQNPFSENFQKTLR